MSLCLCELEKIVYACELMRVNVKQMHTKVTFSV